MIKNKTKQKLHWTAVAEAMGHSPAWPWPEQQGNRCGAIETAGDSRAADVPSVEQHSPSYLCHFNYSNLLQQ